MSTHDPDIIARLQSRFPEAVTPVEAVDQPTVIVPKDTILEVSQYLKEQEGYHLLLDVCAVDWFPARPRFEVVYHLYHPQKFARLRVKAWVGEEESLPSVVSVWPGANWPEREAYDLFGVTFDGHPNLTRIYLPDDWEGHPLRKDYPTGGNRID
ncbi:NADH-quinone oxidoreductase chain c 2 [Sulfobacillus acidophilus TPY]|uniref:NADH-quinone oxidoreductase subunit C n=1 Tax=Sulfobacillus acidophilus (strain ATCC 700253 / DSM 10332 / NAL) TaxID=679936 RepID=G8TYI6_SULAD|nr:NADH-quinone oxidoreductase chain c 2 [Sulfobacillus acidophilus TPY]AEW06247.1 NADH dehydrogenase subunit C [Sulfobacillus acidophilus DSM 10332]